MPSEYSHREQAEYNEQAADSIRQTYPDWAITMCFYSALHWVEWYAKVKGVNIERQYNNCPSPHDRLFDYVRDIATQQSCEDLRKAYKSLKDASQIARYLTSIRTTANVYYSRHRPREVDNSFNNLQIVKQRLSS